MVNIIERSWLCTGSIVGFLGNPWWEYARNQPPANQLWIRDGLWVLLVSPCDQPLLD